MTTSQFYRDQAEREQRLADAATLDEVRERSRRASQAWSHLADQSARAERGRDLLKAEKALSSVPSEPSENPDRGHPHSAG